MKKVCILSSVHSALDVRIFHKEAQTLVRAGYDVTLIAKHDRDSIVDGIKIIALPRSYNRFQRMICTTFHIFRLALKERPNIYHFHDPELIPIGLFLKIISKAKVIYDVHEDVPKQILSKYWIPKSLRRLFSMLFNQFENLTSPVFDYILAATPSIRNRFKTCEVIDIKNYPIVDSTCKTTRNYNKTNYTLIYIGGLRRIRGIEEIIKSLEFINSDYKVKLKLLGNFSDKNFEKEVRRLKNSHRVEFLGWICYEEVHKYLERADIGIVCLYPIKRYQVSLPIKLFEYMTVGIPVIASNFPLWREIVEGNNCGLTVDPLNPKEIAKGIEWLIEHPEEARSMGENGRKAVLKKYNWENESKKLLKVYEELCKK